MVWLSLNLAQPVYYQYFYQHRCLKYAVTSFPGSLMKGRSDTLGTRLSMRLLFLRKLFSCLNKQRRPVDKPTNISTLTTVAEHFLTTHHIANDSSPSHSVRTYLLQSWQRKQSWKSTSYFAATFTRVVRVFLCPRVGLFFFLGLMLRCDNLALQLTLSNYLDHSININNLRGTGVQK